MSAATKCLKPSLIFFLLSPSTRCTTMPSFLPFTKFVMSVTLFVWSRVRREDNLVSRRVSDLQSEQSVRLPPLMWHSTRTTPPTVHTVTFLLFTMVDSHPAQEILHREPVAVFMQICERYRTLPFHVSDHVPQKVRDPANAKLTAQEETAKKRTQNCRDKSTNSMAPPYVYQWSYTENQIKR